MQVPSCRKEAMCEYDPETPPPKQRENLLRGRINQNLKFFLENMNIAYQPSVQKPASLMV